GGWAADKGSLKMLFPIFRLPFSCVPQSEVCLHASTLGTNARCCFPNWQGSLKRRVAVLASQLHFAGCLNIWD
ncbi:MAG: hypothetical protein ACFNLD_08640, partial [Kingella oralis]